MRPLVLVADDEAKIVRLVSSYLTVAGFDVMEASDGACALALAGSRMPDCAVLDIGMPVLDGFALARELRRICPNLPLIFLSARGEEGDRIAGLELGADDYVAKPFSPRELTARVKAVLRRGTKYRMDEWGEVAGITGGPENRGTKVPIVRGGLMLDPLRRSVTVDGDPRELTSVQFSILYTLARQPGRVFDRATLLDKAAGEVFEGFERTLDAHIKNIRRALGDVPGNPRFIATVRGAGYKFIDSGHRG